MAFEQETIHDADELFDLRFHNNLNGWVNWSQCCVCGQLVWLGEPYLFGSLKAYRHRMVCGWRA